MSTRDCFILAAHLTIDFDQKLDQQNTKPDANEDEMKSGKKSHSTHKYTHYEESC